MRVRYLLATILFTISIVSCTKEYDCENLQIQPVFINYLPTDMDTFVLRKFKANDNYQTLIDTFVVKFGSSTIYQTSNDTTSVLILGGNGIKANFDWQLFIPAKNRTVIISDIISEKKTGKRGYGIFSMDPGASCTNDIFSAKVNNQIISFSNSGTAGHNIYIRN